MSDPDNMSKPARDLSPLDDPRHQLDLIRRLYRRQSLELAAWHTLAEQLCGLSPARLGLETGAVLRPAGLDAPRGLESPATVAAPPTRPLTTEELRETITALSCLVTRQDDELRRLRRGIELLVEDAPPRSCTLPARAT